MVEINLRYFLFPIRVYNGHSVRKAERNEENFGAVPDPEYAVGWARLPVRDVEVMHWHDGFSDGRSMEEVEEEGFDCTIVHTERYGSFMCEWKRKEFEEKVEIFLENYDKKYLETVVSLD